MTAKTQTCATRASAASIARHAAARGFTLIELMVALAIAAGIAALVPPALDRLRDGMQYRDAVRSVQSDLRSARQRAWTEGQDVRVVFDLAARRFGIEGQAPRALPESVQMRITVAGIEWHPQQRGSIRFQPQGGATGGSVDLLRDSGHGVRLTVDWLTAAVTQVPIDP